MTKKKLELDMHSLMPLRDVVYHTLRDAILKGEIEPGERLMEIHLANRLGVSRTPIREAIRMLEKEGLAVTFPRKGAQVAKMSIKDLDDVIDIREMLDVLSARNACDKITDGDFKMLDKAHNDFKIAIEGKNTRKIVEADEKFHNVIYGVADNSKLLDIVVTLREQMYRYRFEYVKNESVLQGLWDEHSNIVGYLKSRDKDKLEKMMVSHLRNQYKAVKSMIRRQESAS